ncbi:rho GTPase-activating protein 3 isoform X2 [Macadamia integrifolia]|uniref:rho GTPase-activating protein 3 isoform X2 n=1 Tax=Macadamia integrifolia TaxID=60698 RepID=UPI001C4EF960|nr:rho GTPase-activating protein 3 isoform X2 [Macadamia integrifolia]
MMTQLFRSKSCRLGGGMMVLNYSPPSPSLYLTNDEDEEYEEEEEFEDDDDEEEEDEYFMNPISTPLIVTAGRRERSTNRKDQHHQFPILAILVAALRKSLVTCTVDRQDISSMDISWPTDFRHVSHVTFDRFNGFLGLPVEFEPEVPRRVPSASASVFGVSAESMQCSYDHRGNSIPTILLMMQRRMYLEGGLQAEGIFRINADNSHEEYVRDQLNQGVVAHGIDVHCLAGLIKMADPLTALIHAVQVMNFLKTLILKNLREREESADEARLSSSSCSPDNKDEPPSPMLNRETIATTGVCDGTVVSPNILRSPSNGESGNDTEERLWSFTKSKADLEPESTSWNDTDVKCNIGSVGNDCRGDYSGREVEGFLDRLSLRKGVKKLCSHPVFQLSKPVKKPENLGIVNSRGRGGEAWAQDGCLSPGM